MEPSVRRTDLTDMLLPFLIWLAVYFPLVPFRFLHVDTAVYIIAAQKMLAGGVPYLDCWDHKPPLVYFLYYVILKIFGAKQYCAVTGVTAIFVFANTYGVYLIARRMSSRVCAVVCAVWYPLVSVMLLANDAVVPNTEIYMETFCLLGIWCTLRYFSSHSLWLLLASGASIGIGSAFKQPGGIDLAVTGVAVCAVSCIRAGVWRSLARLFIIAAGFGAVWCAIGLYFAFHGAFEEFWFQAVTFNMLYSGSRTGIEIIKSLAVIYLNGMQSYPLLYGAYFAGMIGAAGISMARSFGAERRAQAVFILVWHACSLIGVSAGGLFYPHYFVQLMPSFCMLMFVPLSCIVQRLSVDWRRVFSICAAIYMGFMAVPFFTVPPDNPHHYTPPVAMYKQYKEYAAKVGADFYYHPVFYNPKFFWDYRRTVQLIRSFAQPNDTIFIWEFAPDLYLAADRAPASRFPYYGFLTGRFHALPSLMRRGKNALRGRRKDIRRLLFEDLEKNRPAVIVTGEEASEAYLEEFYEYLAQNYTRLKQNKSYLTLYVRNDRYGDFNIN